MVKEKEVAQHPKMGMYHFICVCGGSMATNGKLLEEAIIGNKGFRCPNKLYGKCNRTYSAIQFRDMALFIPPQRQD